jgi:hypothetical protein
MNMKEKLSSDTKQFLLTLLATTISIILTFGTSAVIDSRHKERDKREMVKMIIYDFDKTIEQMENASSAFEKAKQHQQELALHPEYFDSLRFQFTDALLVAQMEFSETTENIFSSNIETFNTLGNVNFVHEVSSFYSMRHQYQENLLADYKKEVLESGLMESVGKIIKLDFPDYYFTNQVYLKSLKSTRDLCMKMMKVSEDEMKEFSNQRIVNEDHGEDYGISNEQLMKEMFEEEEILKQAREKLEQNQ